MLFINQKYSFNMSILRLQRGSQSYVFPIQLSDQILPPPIFYGTIAPVLIWTLVNKLFLEPYEEEKKRIELQKKRAAYREQYVKQPEQDNTI